MSVLGQMLAGGVAAGANFAADQMGRDYERQGDLDAKMKLEERAAQLRQQLEEQRQAWQSGENTLQRAAENDRNTANNATIQRGQDMRIAETGMNLAEQSRHNQVSEGIAKTQAGSAAAFHQAQIELAKSQQKLAEDKFALDKANAIPRDIQLQYNSLDARIKAAEAELKGLDPIKDPDGKRKVELTREISNHVSMQTTLLGSLRSSGGAAAGSGKPAVDTYPGAASPPPSAAPAASPSPGAGPRDPNAPKPLFTPMPQGPAPADAPPQPAQSSGFRPAAPGTSVGPGAAAFGPLAQAMSDAASSAGSAVSSVGNANEIAQYNYLSRLDPARLSAPQKAMLDQLRQKYGNQ